MFVDDATGRLTGLHIAPAEMLISDEAMQALGQAATVDALREVEKNGDR